MLIALMGDGPMQLSTRIAKQACKELVAYYEDGSVEGKVGQQNEEIVYSIIRLLNGQAYMAPQGSAMDCCLKGDIILEVGKTAYVWQVKSGQQAAKAHLGKKALYSGRRYPTPGVILVQSSKEVVKPTWRLDALLDISRQADLPVCNTVVKAVDGFNKARGKTIPLGVVPSLDAIYKPEVVNCMTFLGLASLKQGKTLVIR